MLVTIACGLIVMLYAAKRYDTPETNRLSTTKPLFFLTGAGYMATSLMLFLLLCEIVLKPGVLTFLGVAQDTISKFASPPVLAAVILTTMLPNVAVLNTADEWLLKRFQRWGRIPHGVGNLADMLAPNRLPLQQDDLDKLKTWIKEDGDIPNEIAKNVRSVSDLSSHGLFTRILWLYRELEKLDALSSYIKAFRVNQEGWQTVRDDFRVFTAQSQAFFLLFDQLRLVDGAAGEDALKQAGDRYREICRKIYRQLTELLARLLLNVEASEFRIQFRLQSMGFAFVEPPPPLPIGPFLFMGVVMILAILSVIAVVQPDNGRSSIPLTTAALLIGITKMIGVLAAILPKVRWAWFRPANDRTLPYLPWLTSAFLAMLVAFVVERLAIAILYHGLSEAINFEKFPLTPLAPTTFTLSLAIAIVCDIDFRLGNGLLRRISEGMLCGATMASTIFVCLKLLDITSATAAQTWPWFPFIFSFSIGFVSGFFGPYLYRRTCGVTEQPPNMTNRPGTNEDEMAAV